MFYNEESDIFLRLIKKKLTVIKELVDGQPNHRRSVEERV
jgi:hypothetical protein